MRVPLDALPGSKQNNKKTLASFAPLRFTQLNLFFTYLTGVQYFLCSSIINPNASPIPTS